MNGHFYIDPDALLDPLSPVNRLPDDAFRFGWMQMVGAAAEREDTYFEQVDLDLLTGFTDAMRDELVRVRLLNPEDAGWRLSSFGWSPENEGD